VSPWMVSVPPVAALPPLLVLAELELQAAAPVASAVMTAVLSTAVLRDLIFVLLRG
jgi:hypothetical protein